MKMQLALDRLTKDECFALIEETKESIDWIEIGTGVIKEYGMEIIRSIKSTYPDKIIVADMKTCDAGRAEATQAFSAGADVTTVMAFASDKTITDTIEVAKEFGGMVMIDLLGIQDNKRLEELYSLNVDLVSLHVGKDLQESNISLSTQFELVKSFHHFKKAVAGGIDLFSLPSIMKENPEVIIVGSAITKAISPKEIAFTMKELIRNYDKRNG